MRHKLIVILVITLIATNCSIGVKSIPPSVQENVDATVTNNLLAIKKSSAADDLQLMSRISPNGQWEIKVERLNSDYEIGDFYALKLQEKSAKNGRTLFTLWDADVDAGARFRISWTPDSKAVRLKIDTRGFDYNNPNPPLTYKSFDYIYVADTATLYTTP